MLKTFVYLLVVEAIPRKHLIFDLNNKCIRKPINDEEVSGTSSLEITAEDFDSDEDDDEDDDDCDEEGGFMNPVDVDASSPESKQTNQSQMNNPCPERQQILKDLTNVKTPKSKSAGKRSTGQSPWIENDQMGKNLKRRVG